MVSDQTAANTKQQQTVDAINRNRACANVALERQQPFAQGRSMATEYEQQCKAAHRAVMSHQPADEIVLTLVNPRQLGPEIADEGSQQCESATTAVRRTKMSGDMMGGLLGLPE